MKEGMDWKLFCIVLSTIVLSFILVLFDKDLEFPLALLAVGSNILTAYVAYRFGKFQVGTKTPWWPRFLFFVLILATIVLIFFTAYYTASMPILLLAVALLIYILLAYSIMTRGHY